MPGEPTETVAETASRASVDDRDRTTLYLVDENSRDAISRAFDRSNLLVGALDETVVEAAMRCRRAVQTPPNRFTVVGQAEPTRSASAANGGGDAQPLPFSTATIDGAADFATFVEHVDTTLAEWVGSNTSVVVEGVESALDSEGEEAVFRFLHALTRAVAARDAKLSVTVDPSVVDHAVFEPLFDVVVDCRRA